MVMFWETVVALARVSAVSLARIRVVPAPLSNNEPVPKALLFCAMSVPALKVVLPV